MKSPTGNLSSRVKLEISKKLKEYANKMGRDHLGGDDIPANKNRGGLRDNDGYDNVQYNRDMPQDEEVTPPNSKKVEVLKKAIQKINKKYKVQISTHPVTKGEVTIELGKGNHSDNVYDTIEKLVTKLGIKHHSVFNEDIVDQAFLKADPVEEQGVGTATVFLKNQEELEEGGLPQNWMAGRVSDYHTKLRGKRKKYDDTNFTKMNTGQPDIEDEELDPDDEIVNETFDNVLHLKLLTKAMKEMPGSDKQKQYIRQLNKIRKSADMKPLKETAIEEYASRLTNAYILDDESILKGTPEPKDAIDVNEANTRVFNPGKRPIVTNNKGNEFILQGFIKSGYYLIPYDGSNYWEHHRIPKSKWISIDKVKWNDYDYSQNDFKKLQKAHGISNQKTLKKFQDMSEETKRDYKDEYKKFQSSTKSKKYRAELNKYNRDKGTYGNGDGKDASHKGGKIVGFESESKNRGRKEKSRLKKK